MAKEDARFITGRGCHTGDLTLPDQAHGAVVRSAAVTIAGALAQENSGATCGAQTPRTGRRTAGRCRTESARVSRRWHGPPDWMPPAPGKIWFRRAFDCSDFV
jgi:hypothetical protein